MKELDFTFYEGQPETVNKITRSDLDCLLKRTAPGDNQRRTYGYYIIADDNKLQRV